MCEILADTACCWNLLEFKIGPSTSKSKCMNACLEWGAALYVLILCRKKMYPSISVMYSCRFHMI